MREHRKMTLKRIGIGILCMVFVLSMLAPLVAFAEEKTCLLYTSPSPRD